MDQLASKLRNVDRMETELVGLKLRGDVSDVAYDRQGALLRAERSYYEDEIERQSATPVTFQQTTEALDSLARMRDSIVERLESSTAENRRWVLQALDTKVTVNRGQLIISLGIPSYIMASDCVPATDVA